MGCCGEKRKQWQTENKPPLPQSKEEVRPGPDRRSFEFEYIGDHSMTIHGVATGKKYHFRFRGDRQIVDHYDGFAMMAERDLKSL